MPCCQSCLHWQPREHRLMAKEGLAMCALGKRYTFFPPQHSCEKHAAAPAAIVEKRKTMKGGNKC